MTTQLYKHGLVEVPEDWTACQWVSAIHVCEHHKIKFVPKDWINYGDYIGHPGIAGMFIGIEKDGYAHT
jgi:hypothetical protein